MLQRLKAYIDEQHLIPDSRRQVLLAVSGGRDSVCMVHLMHRAGFDIAIAHCNFHLRPGDCDRDQKFVRSLADSLGVPFFTTDFDTRRYAFEHGMGIEEAARHLRYEYFSSLRTSLSPHIVATAHQRDDSIETFFLNLFRGTGITGLHGIRPISEMRIQNEELRVIRPLLCFSRAEIDRYVEENHLEYVEDHTNYELDARRNRIRHQLMPLLREMYPSVDVTMADNIERFHDVGLVYHAHVEELRSRVVVPYRSRLPHLPMPIHALALAALPEPQTTLLFELLRPYGFNAATASDILAQPSRSGRLFHSPTHLAELHRGQLLVAPKTHPVPPAVPVQAPQTVRIWQSGDRFHPKGMKGSRLVSDFLKDMNLSRIERQHVWLLVDGDDRILSVIGLRDAD